MFFLCHQIYWVKHARPICSSAFFFQVRDNIPTMKYIKYANHKCGWWFFTYVYTYQSTKGFWLPSTLSQFILPPEITTLLKINWFYLFSTSCKWNHTVYTVLCLAYFINIITVIHPDVFVLSVVHLFIVDYPVVWICHNSFIYSPVDGICIFFQFRAITHKAAINILVPVVFVGMCTHSSWVKLL